MSDISNNCRSCGETLPDGAKFCVACGASTEGPLSPELSEEAIGLQTVSNLPTLPADGLTAIEGGAHLQPSEEIAGKFRIESLIGQGGMGTVYRATEILSGKTAAVKLISPKYVASDKAVQRLIDEGTTTRDISHSNVVKVYDIGLHQQQPYIAMEFIDGEPLHVWRSKKMASDETVPAAVAAQIVKEVLSGLQVAHEAGVIHRDLKPENIMLLGEPTAEKAHVKIVDFGIALATKSNTQTGTGTGLGTQLYMAPEQIRNANAANASADLYSVSKIFYELIVGVLPTGHWQPPSRGRSDVPRGIDRLIEDGLSPNRSMRPQTAETYRTRLIRAMNGLEEHAAPTGQTLAPTQKTKKGGGATVAIVIGVVVIGFLTIIGLIGLAIEDTGGYPPDPPPNNNNYYSGVWNDGFGGSYSLNASNNGSLTGTGILADGSPVTFNGRMTNSGITYTLASGGQVFAEGSGQKTDQCHFTFNSRRLSDGLRANGMFHVNHNAGQPCP